MKLSLVANADRVKQRKLEVMQTAWRARNFPKSVLTREAAEFIRFGLEMSKSTRRN